MNNKIEISFARSQIIVLPVSIFFTDFDCLNFNCNIRKHEHSSSLRGHHKFGFICYTMPTIPNNVSLIETLASSPSWQCWLLDNIH